MFKPLLTLLLSLLGFLSFAQDFSYGKINKEDFDKGNYAPDAEAIVLHEFGKARIEYNSIKKQLNLRYFYHTKILIKNKEGLDYANFSVPLYKERNRSDRETIAGIKGTTYNLLPNGEIEKTELDKKNILNEKSSETQEITKIALANVKEGSIIELRYSTESPYLYNLESWQFQSTIPKMHSEFITEIPEICVYNVNMKGIVHLSKHTKLPYDTQIVSSLGDVMGQQTIYVANNIPAFVQEDYMTAAKNFMGKLTFELASFSIPFGPNYNFSRTWTDVVKQLNTANEFGKEVNRSGQFKQVIPTIVKNDMTTLVKAQTIYDYIKTQIKWNKKYGLYSDNGVKKALEIKQGNTADINFALIGALRDANIEANPVVLSTRDNGIPSLYNATLSDYNYVIAHVLIDSQEYLLDASDMYAAFGQIPLRCINYQGLLVSKDNFKWVPLTAIQISRVRYEFVGDLDEEGNLKGQWTVLRNGYAASNKRNEIKAFNSLDEYRESELESTPHYSIKEHHINNLEDPYSMLTEIQQIEIKNFASKKGQDLKFIPFISGRKTKNPFNLDERTYPVDLGSYIEESFSMVINMPKNYKINNKPKNVSLSLPNRDARYIYIIKENENELQIQVSLGLNKAIFLPEEYLHLKEFYSQIIQSQALDITLSGSTI